MWTKPYLFPQFYPQKPRVVHTCLRRQEALYNKQNLLAVAVDRKATSPQKATALTTVKSNPPDSFNKSTVSNTTTTN